MQLCAEEKALIMIVENAMLLNCLNKKFCTFAFVHRGSISRKRNINAQQLHTCLNGHTLQWQANFWKEILKKR